MKENGVKWPEKRHVSQEAADNTTARRLLLDSNTPTTFIEFLLNKVLYHRLLINNSKRKIFSNSPIFVSL